MQTFSERLHAMAQAFPKDEPFSVCLNHSLFSYFTNEQVRQLAYFYRRKLSVGRIRIFYAAMRQDRELESLWAQDTLKTTNPTRLSTRMRVTDKTPLTHSRVLSAVQSMLSEDITVTVGDGSAASIADGLGAFARWLGVDVAAQGPVLSPSTLQRAGGLALPHRRVLELVQSLHPVMQAAQQGSGLPVWAQEQALLRHGLEEPSCGWYLRKQERDMLLSQHAAGNAALARDARLVSAPHAVEAFQQRPHAEMSVEHASLQREDAETLLDLLSAPSREGLARGLRTLAESAQGRTLRLVHQVLLPQTSVRISEGSPPPRVTVLTLAYNQQAYIEQNMRSVCAQNAPFPLRHVLLDNFSTDDTFARIQQYAAQHPHIVPLRNHKDPTAALFSMADSEYVCLCDGDDYFCDADKIRLQAAYLDAHPECALCFHPARVTFEDSDTPDSVHPDPALLSLDKNGAVDLKKLLRYNCMQTSSVMYRWRFVQGLPDWFHSFLVPGDWYWHLLHAEMGRAGYIDRIMSVYRRHKDAMYAGSEDIVSHRQRTGLRELEVLAMLNTHFSGAHAQAFTYLALGVFGDLACAANATGRAEQLEMAAQGYPAFAKAFYEVLSKGDAHA